MVLVDTFVRSCSAASALLPGGGDGQQTAEVEGLQQKHVQNQQPLETTKTNGKAFLSQLYFRVNSGDMFPELCTFGSGVGLGCRGAMRMFGR